VWIREKAEEKRDAGYAITVGFFLEAARTDLIPWLRQNPQHYQRYEAELRKQANEIQKQATIAQFPDLATHTDAQLATCRNCGQEAVYPDGVCYSTQCLVRKLKAGDAGGASA
jgi:hypothetical protein